MKMALTILAFITPFLAQAKIDVSAISSTATSSDIEATQLLQSLEALGVGTFHDVLGHEELSVQGQITITNGAACDNGHPSYEATLEVLNDKGAVVRSIEIDDSTECNDVSKAQKLYELMDKWGGSTLEGDCGLGHCWEKIDVIQCTRFPASSTYKAFDSCNVGLSAGG